MHATGNTILITGGGGGIGAALAQRLHDRGNHVIVAGRDRVALERAIAGRPRMAAMTVDIDDPDAVAAFGQAVVAAHPALNMLINNAGIMRFEAIDRHRELADVEAMVRTNLLGPICLINALVDHLLGQAGASIVNVSSGLAFMPRADAAAYSATKAALHTYTLALRTALKGRVEVIEIVPPGVRTELTLGQSNLEAMLPLDAFADEVMDLLSIDPTPEEILVQRVRPLRFAEADGRLSELLALMKADGKP